MKLYVFFRHTNSHAFKVPISKKFVSLFAAVSIVIAIAYGMYYNVDEAVNTAAKAGHESDINSSIAVGQLYLTVTGYNGEVPARILINGAVSGYLDSATKVLDIRNGNTVEFDARETVAPVSVVITGKSDNIAGECVGRTVEAYGGIHSLGTFALAVKK